MTCLRADPDFQGGSVLEWLFRPFNLLGRKNGYWNRFRSLEQPYIQRPTIENRNFEFPAKTGPGTNWPFRPFIMLGRKNGYRNRIPCLA